MDDRLPAGGRATDASLIDGDAVILSGGGSTRMGTDKALVRIGGLTLIERAAAALGSIFSRVSVSIDPSRPYPSLRLPQIPDAVRGRGPIEGVRASLERLQAPVFFAAVDLATSSGRPGWAGLARALWLEGAKPGRRGAVPRWAGGIEPAMALYTPSLLPDITHFVAGGRRSLRGLASLPGVTLLDLEEEGVRRAVFPEGAPPLAALFRNLNSPEDVRDLGEIPE